MLTAKNATLLEDLYDVVQKHRPTSQSEDKMFITNAEFCDIFNCSRVTSYRLRKAGKLPYEQVGNLIKYDYDSLMVAIRTAKATIKWMPKREAVERLSNYRKLIEL